LIDPPGAFVIDELSIGVNAMSKIVRPTSVKTQATYELAIPETDQKVSVEVDLIPAKDMPEALRKNTNVARVEIGGNEFFVVAGKTAPVA
jgi:hypothetical protein